MAFYYVSRKHGYHFVELNSNIQYPFFYFQKHRNIVTFNKIRAKWHNDWPCSISDGQYRHICWEPTLLLAHNTRCNVTSSLRDDHRGSFSLAGGMTYMLPEFTCIYFLVCVADDTTRWAYQSQLCIIFLFFLEAQPINGTGQSIWSVWDVVANSSGQFGIATCVVTTNAFTMCCRPHKILLYCSQLLSISFGRRLNGQWQ